MKTLILIVLFSLPVFGQRADTTKASKKMYVPDQQLQTRMNRLMQRMEHLDKAHLSDTLEIQTEWLHLLDSLGLERVSEPRKQYKRK